MANSRTLKLAFNKALRELPVKRRKLAKMEIAYRCGVLISTVNNWSFPNYNTCKGMSIPQVAIPVIEEVLGKDVFSNTITV